MIVTMKDDVSKYRKSSIIRVKLQLQKDWRFKYQLKLGVSIFHQIKAETTSLWRKRWKKYKTNACEAKIWKVSDLVKHFLLHSIEFVDWTILNWCSQITIRNSVRMKRQGNTSLEWTFPWLQQM